MTAINGIILKGIGGFYYVMADDKQVYTTKARGLFRKQKITPMVGDAVMFTPGEGEEDGVIEEILPRTNELIRPPVANLEYLCIAIAPIPKPDLMMVDMLLIQARKQGIKTMLILNKADLDEKLCREIQSQYAGSGCTTVITSAKTGTGLPVLASLLKQGICCFAGQSGMGKSSLVAAVTGISLEIGEISEKIARGKHTTRHAELLIHDGFKVLDTAGFSLLSQAEPEDPVFLREYYPEFEPYQAQCRFQPCYHQSEPGCAVLNACQEGFIAQERVVRYHQLLENAKEAWDGRYE